MATDPIHQFEIQKLIPIEIGGVDFSFTNSALFMVLTVRRRFGVPDPVDARPRPGAGPLAVGGRGDLRVRRQDAPRLRPAARGCDSSPSSSALFMFILFANLIGHVPLFLHGHLAHHHHRDHGGLVIVHGHRLRLLPPRLPLPQAVRAERRADGAPALRHLHRGAVLHLAADLAVDPAFRQHARRPHHAEGVRRLRRDPRLARLRSASSARSCRSPRRWR